MPLAAGRRQAGGMSTTTENTGAAGQAGPPPLTRPVQDRMLAGVAAGLARHLGLDPTVVRIAFALLALIGGAGAPLYLIGWLLMPEEGAERSIAGQFLQSGPAR